MDPAVDVELHVPELEPAARVRLAQRREEQRRQHRQVDLPPVRVARQADEGPAEGAQPFGGARTVGEDEGRRAGGDAPERGPDVFPARDAVADAHDGERHPAEPHARPGVLEHLVPVAAEGVGRAARVDPHVVVPEDRHRGGGEAAEQRSHVLDVAGRVGEVVAGEHDEVRGERVRLLHRAPHELGGGVGADVDVRELGDAHPVVRRVQPGHEEGDVLRPGPLLGRLREHGDAGGRRGGAEDGGALEEPSATEAHLARPPSSGRDLDDATRNRGGRFHGRGTRAGGSVPRSTMARPRCSGGAAPAPRGGRPARRRRAAYRPRSAAGGTPSAFAIFSIVSSGGDRCPRSSIET